MARGSPTGGFDDSPTGTSASTLLFVPTGQRWNVGPSMSGDRAYHAAVLLADGDVLIVGGRRNLPVPGAPLATTERLVVPPR